MRDGGRVVNKALVIAHGVHETGRREILSIDVGEAETKAFWTGFLRGLVARGLVGVQLAISDAHAGLKTAIHLCRLGGAARSVEISDRGAQSRS